MAARLAGGSTTTERGAGAVAVRIATSADIPEMHRVRMSVRQNELSDPSRVQTRHYEEMLARRGRGWVAELEGRVIGFAIVDLEARDIWALFVDPAVEGRGIGRQLHRVMLDWAFGSGVERLSLSTSVATRAEAFYAAAGWRLVHCTGVEARFEMERQQWQTR